MMKTEKMRKEAKEIARALRCISTAQDRARAMLKRFGEEADT